MLLVKVKRRMRYGMGIMHMSVNVGIRRKLRSVVGEGSPRAISTENAFPFITLWITGRPEVK